MNIEKLNYSEISGENRFEFWNRAIPRQIKVWEVELWRRYKLLQLIQMHKRGSKDYIGRFRVFPEVTDDEIKHLWDDFKQSIARGEERMIRFGEVISQIQETMPQALQEAGLAERDDVLVIALTGSAFYGPRVEGCELTDFDIHFLLDETQGEGFNILPDKKHERAPFHFVGTGLHDEQSRQFPIHWFLWPHFPIFSKLSDEKFSQIQKDLIQETLARREDIKGQIEELDDRIEDAKKEIIF